MIRKIFILILVICFIICPSFASAKSFMEQALNSWVGYSINNLIDSWGYPSDERTIGNRHLYYFNSSRNQYVPQSSNTYGNVWGNTYNATTTTYGGYTQTLVCNKTIEVDDDNIIISWQWQGNACPGTYLTGKRLVNPKNNEWERKKNAKKLARSKNTIIYEYREPVKTLEENE